MNFMDLMDYANSQTIADTLNMLADSVHMDALAHGLFDSYMRLPADDLRARLAYRVEDEVLEAVAACDAPEHYAEELADVILTALSISKHLGIDIGEAVEAKRQKNIARPFRHAEEV